MSTKKMFSKATLILMIAVFMLLGCEKLENESIAEIDVANGNQSLLKSTLSANLTTVSDIIVNTTSDVADFAGAKQVVDLPGPDGLVSLREAVIAANNTGGPNVIGFNIPTTDPGFNGMVFKIKYLSLFPGLYDNGITINGSTQAEFTGNTNENGPEVELDGSLLDKIEEINRAFIISSAQINIHCLGISHFSSGIGLQGNIVKDVRITGCYIGVDPTGTNISAPPMNNGPNINQFGIHVQSEVTNVQIGGQSAEERNIICGYSYGVFISSFVNGVIIEGNYIGADLAGLTALSNGFGVTIVDHSKNIRLKNNLISGNLYSGIMLVACENIQIEGNIIGPDINGGLTLMNGEFGISFNVNESENNVCSLIKIGGKEPGEGNNISGNGWDGIFTGISSIVLNNCSVENNTISHNSNSGINIANGNNLLIKRNAIFANGGGIFVCGQGHGNWISENSIYENNQIGIDLLSDGVTQNDPGDADTGPNNFMNFPVLSSAKITPGKLHVKGTIDTPVPKNVIIEFFTNPVPTPGGDPSGYGEGAIFLGTVCPNPQGKFTANLPTVKPGTLISATATDSDGNTSEFSLNIEAK